MTKKTVDLPEGYVVHDGGECPVSSEALVDCLIRTAEGIGHSGVMRAKLHEWDASLHADGIGSVVGYRTAAKGDVINLRVRHDEAAVMRHFAKAQKKSPSK